MSIKGALVNFGKIVSTKRSKPDFFIVGAQKSGTTSLHSYLSSREGFQGSHPKETHYFDREERYAKGNGWYERSFWSGLSSSPLRFEATPTYLHRKVVPERIYNYNPCARIIIILRDPILRAYSAWNMYRQWAEEGAVPTRMKKDIESGRVNRVYDAFFRGKCPSFKEYIDLEMELIFNNSVDEEPSLLRRGLYKEQIQRYIELFSWDNVLILGFNEIRNDSESVIRKCHEFLDVPYQAPEFVGETQIKNKREYPSQISSSELTVLQQFYERPNKELFEYLGFQPDW